MPPTRLSMTRTRRTPEGDLREPFSVSPSAPGGHTHPYRPGDFPPLRSPRTTSRAIPIPPLSSSVETAASLSLGSLPQLTDAQTQTDPIIHTPQYAGSRPFNNSPSSLGQPKSLPHAADLLGTPRESSRNSARCVPPMDVDMDAGPSNIAPRRTPLDQTTPAERLGLRERPTSSRPRAGPSHYRSDSDLVFEPILDPHRTHAIARPEPMVPHTQREATLLYPAPRPYVDRPLYVPEALPRPIPNDDAPDFDFDFGRPIYPTPGNETNTSNAFQSQLALAWGWTEPYVARDNPPVPPVPPPPQPHSLDRYPQFPFIPDRSAYLRDLGNFNWEHISAQYRRNLEWRAQLEQNDQQDFERMRAVFVGAPRTRPITREESATMPLYPLVPPVTEPSEGSVSSTGAERASSREPSVASSAAGPWEPPNIVDVWNMTVNPVDRLRDPRQVRSTLEQRHQDINQQMLEQQEILAEQRRLAMRARLARQRAADELRRYTTDHVGQETLADRHAHFGAGDPTSSLAALDAASGPARTNVLFGEGTDITPRTHRLARAFQQPERRAEPPIAFDRGSAEERARFSRGILDAMDEITREQQAAREALASHPFLRRAEQSRRQEDSLHRPVPAVAPVTGRDAAAWRRAALGDAPMYEPTWERTYAYSQPGTEDRWSTATDYSSTSSHSTVRTRTTIETIYHTTSETTRVEPERQVRNDGVRSGMSEYATLALGIGLLEERAPVLNLTWAQGLERLKTDRRGVGLEYRTDMTCREKKTLVGTMKRGLGRINPKARAEAAMGVSAGLEYGQWDEVVDERREIMDGVHKEDVCGVCHDDYEDNVDITVTPCKHMYHKECLNLWFQQPNETPTSCPMCRRDLAMLAIMPQYMKQKAKATDVTEAWLSIQ